MISEEIKLRIGDRVIYNNKIEEIISFYGKSILITNYQGWPTIEIGRARCTISGRFKDKNCCWVKRSCIDMVPTFPYKIK